VQEHQGWRLLTCIWLHAGVAHLLANMISLVLIGLRLEQQFGYGMHSCRNLTPPGLSRTMSDLDLHSRFLTVRIGIPCFWRWRQRALISVHQEHHLCQRFWSSVRTPWCHAVRALHQLDRLLCFDLQYIDTVLYVLRVLRVLHTILLCPRNTCPQDP